jgi:hypothetical protein
MYRQATFLKRGKDKKQYPIWLRLAFLAMGRRRKNGHAVFAVGELQELLDANRDQVAKAIKGSVAAGWLDRQSISTNHRCLIVPLDDVCQGQGGSLYSPCPYCGSVKS